MMNIYVDIYELLEATQLSNVHVVQTTGSYIAHLAKTDRESIDTTKFTWLVINFHVPMGKERHTDAHMKILLRQFAAKNITISTDGYVEVIL